MTYRLHKAIWNPGSNNPILGLAPAAYYPYGQGITVTGAGVSMWADVADSDNSLVLPGVAGNTATSPDSVPISVAGDFSVVVDLAMPDWTPAAANTLFAHSTSFAAGIAWALQMSTAGVPILYTSADGTTLLTHSATASTGFTDGERNMIAAHMDVNDGGGNRVVKFYKSTDGGDNWTHLGNTVTTAGATTIFDSTAVISVGSTANNTQPATAKIYRAQLWSGDFLSGGAILWDANFEAQAKGTTSFSESSSNAATVTVNQSGALPAHIGSQKDLLQGTDGNRPAYSGGIITFDGVDNYLKTNAFTLVQPETVYLVVNQVSWTSADEIFDGNTASTMLARQYTTTPNIGIFAGTGFIQTNPDLAIGTFGVLVSVFNGASSAVAINQNAVVTGNAGASNAGGFTLGANATPGGYSNIAVKECAIFPAAHDAATRSLIISYLMAKHGIS